VTWDRSRNGSPFCGLAPFDAAHSTVFFGRDAAIERVLAKLSTARFLLLIGASGVGKSSLLRAGVLPRLVAKGESEGTHQWRAVVVTPSEDTFSGLAAALAGDAVLGQRFRDAGLTAARLAALLRGGGAAALAPIRDALAATAPARLVLGVDRLERLFVEAKGEDVAAFADLLHSLVVQELAHVITTLRADAYGAFQAIGAFVALREAGAMHDLAPPEVGDFVAMVVRPVLASQPPLAFEKASDGRSLALVLIDDATGPDALPLLQLTLDRLFAGAAARGDGALRFADYHGIDQAVVEMASAAFAGIDAAASDSLPSLIVGLAHDVALDPASGRPMVTVRPLARADFERDRPERKALIDSLLKHRLLVSEGEHGERVRPIHDVLLRIWPQAAHILTENEASIRVRRTLEPLVGHWLAAGRPARSDYLLTSPAHLAAADVLIARFGDDVPTTMRDYVAASHAAENRQRDYERLRRPKLAPAAEALLRRGAAYYAPLLALVIALAMIVRYDDPQILDRLRSIAFDSYQRLSPAEQNPQRPVRIVDIDERSVAAFGEWPWPRTRLAELAQALSARGAAAIVFDLPMSAADRWSPEEYVKSLPADRTQEFGALLGSGRTNDQIFAAALEKTPSVIAVTLHDAVAASAPDQPDAKDCRLEPFGKAGFAWARDCPKSFIDDFKDANVLPLFAQSAPGLGAVAYEPDPDGVVRRIALVLRHGDKLIPALAAEAVRVAHGVMSYVIGSSNAGSRHALGAVAGLDFIAIGGLQIVTDPNGAIVLKYRRTNPVSYISAADILDKSAPAPDVSGKIVLIGRASDDLLPTPLDAATPSIDIHAQMIETLLSNSGLVRPAYVLPVEEGMVFAVGAILIGAMLFLSLRATAAVGLVLALTFIAGSLAAYQYANVLIDPVYAILVLVILFGMVVLIRVSRQTPVWH